MSGYRLVCGLLPLVSGACAGVRLLCLWKACMPSWSPHIRPPTAVQEVITINVQPGWKDGTRITYAGAGDELPGQPPQANLSGLASTPGTHIACQ